MNDITVWVVMLVFYGGLLVGLYVRVQDKKHISRNVFKSYSLVLGSLLAAIALSSMLIWLVVALFDLQRGRLATAFGVGVIVVSFVRAWKWSFSVIELPSPNYVFQEKKAPDYGQLIPKEQYLIKYKTTEKKLMSSISKGKIKSSVESGVLTIEDRKC